MKKILIISCLIIIVTSAITFFFFINKKDIDTTNNRYNSIRHYKSKYLSRYKLYEEKNPKKNIEQIITEVNIGLDKPFYTNTNEVKNITNTMLVNKYYYLNKEYVPDNLIKIDFTSLTKTAGKAFIELKLNAQKDNLNIIAISGYRSYTYQEKLYNKYVKIDGKEKADTYSAKPGHSEHQTGLAVDISNGITSYMNFENTDEYKWMINNAYKYGFILRYPKGKETITGYNYESWHYRYVGINIATYIKKHNITFDEYYVRFIESSF